MIIPTIDWLIMKTILRFWQPFLWEKGKDLAIVISINGSVRNKRLTCGIAFQAKGLTLLSNWYNKLFRIILVSKGYTLQERQNQRVLFSLTVIWHSKLFIQLMDTIKIELSSYLRSWNSGYRTILEGGQKVHNNDNNNNRIRV